jgi:hypothetical protein
MGSFFTIFANRDHQVLYGRRGTGKTHALSYLADQIEKKGDIAIQVDMRTIGSTGGLYSDTSVPIAERGTRLLMDTLSQLHEQLFSASLRTDMNVDLSVVGPALDDFASAITEVSVIGDVRVETSENTTRDALNELSSSFNISANPSVGFEAGSSRRQQESIGLQTERKGVERHRVHFGRVLKTLTALVENMPSSRIWVLLDEWTEIPQDLQPILADLIRRTLLPVQHLTVKISAIEQRSRFRKWFSEDEYIGIEVGADIATSLDLDDYLVFDNDAEKAKQFFGSLLHRHVSSLIDQDSNFTDEMPSESELIRLTFTNKTSFAEFVRAAEGVPRDGINVLSLAAQKSDGSPISVPTIRVAAKTWYNRAKEAAIQKQSAKRLLRLILDEVIQHRRARAFMLRTDVESELIETLFDARVLHIIKKDVSTNERPGIRYNVWSIDYGCYVDLINTNSEPLGLFEIDTGSGPEYVEVPDTDYRAIRRAILDIERLQSVK